ncbi:MAG: hypothetical protein H9847_08540 [Candidatus Anaerobiospirillum pullicola]|uniref:Uncharacterized protein n=1 Tax=Candidatus Anaerobiospirillum pullicola TaxID=2838451 RepID=A0A948THB6_9GAMM|nr:hypothetical protein [Candidatus Anaerobiospirillum pullicola]
MENTPIDQTYRQSYLQRAGVRFDFNIVDTVCRRKLNFSFYLALIAALLVFGLPPGMWGHPVSEGEQALSSGWLLLYNILFLSLIAYLGGYLLRLVYFLRLRAKLRRDDAPLAVEAYAVVCLDVKRGFGDYLSALWGKIVKRDSTYYCRYAVLYKEVGTMHPRFFLTAATSARKIFFIPEHVGLVFLHRKKEGLYTLDDKGSYQTASEKRTILDKMLQPSANLAPKSGSEVVEKHSATATAAAAAAAAAAAPVASDMSTQIKESTSEQA